MITWGIVSAAMMFVQRRRRASTCCASCSAWPRPGFFPGHHPLPDALVPGAGPRPRDCAVHDRDRARRRDRRPALGRAAARWTASAACTAGSGCSCSRGCRRSCSASWCSRCLPDGPEHARWLAPAERDWLDRRRCCEQDDAASGVHGTQRSGRVAQRTPVAARLSLFLDHIALYGVSFWLPQILQAALRHRAIRGRLPLGAAVHRRGRRHGDRGQALGPDGRARAGTSRCPAWSAPPALCRRRTGRQPGRFARGAVGGRARRLGHARPVLGAAADVSARRRAAAGGIAPINSVGNIGGFVGPYFVGYVRDVTGDFSAGLWLMSGSLLIAVIIAVVLARLDRVRIVAPAFSGE